jgi:hypothetical protein
MMDINPLYLLILVGAWVFSVVLWYYLLFVRLPRAPKDIVEYILDRLDDPDDKEIADMFALLMIRIYDGVTKNPELKAKFIGFMQNQILSAIKQFQSNLKNKGPAEGGGFLENIIMQIVGSIGPDGFKDILTGMGRRY